MVQTNQNHKKAKAARKQPCTRHQSNRGDILYMSLYIVILSTIISYFSILDPKNKLLLLR